jgi:large subunit ribosomal protein L21
MSHFAIIQTGGKQYRVKAGDTLQIERFDHGKSKTLKLSNVLLYSKDGALEVGKPFVKGAYAEAELVKEVRSPKTISFKYIRREKGATKIGHRQNYFEIKVKSLHKEA